MEKSERDKYMEIRLKMREFWGKQYSHFSCGWCVPTTSHIFPSAVIISGISMWVKFTWPGRSGLLFSDCGKTCVWMGMRKTTTLNSAGSQLETMQETSLEMKATQGGVQSQGNWQKHRQELFPFLDWSVSSLWIFQKQNQYIWFIV